MDHAGVHLQRQRSAIGQPQRRFKTFGQALRHVLTHLQPVHHHIDVVLFVLHQRRQISRLHHLPIDAKAHIALGLHLGKQLNVLPLAVAHDGRQDHQLGLWRQGQHGIHHLAHALRLQGHTMLRAKRRTRAGIQQAQVIVNLGHRAHGRARVVAGRFLLNADRGRQALDHVHIGLVHELQELPRIGAQALDVTALALGIQRVKRQAGFARARQPGDHHQLVAWQVQVNVFQVVGACATDMDVLQIDR